VSQPLVLAIEPDLRQAAIVKRIVREKALADVVVVDSLDAAMEAMRTSMPDVLLVSTLLSPRDEDELMAHLKTLDNAGHLQTHTIPQLASALGAGEERASRGLLSAFRRKKEAAMPGCDPELFADEIRVYLQQAIEKKQHLRHTPFVAPVRRSEGSAASSEPSAAAETEEAAPESAWASPFEWKPSPPSSRPARGRKAAPAPAPEPVAAAPVVEAPAEAAPELAEPLIAQPAYAEAAAAEPAGDTILAAPPVVDPVVLEPILAEPVAVEPLIAPAALDLTPVVEAPLEAKPVEPIRELAEPVVQIVERPVEAPAAKPARDSDAELAIPAAAAKKAKPVEAPRPKAVADRPARLTGRIQLKDLIKPRTPGDDFSRERLGPLARWARSDAPRAVKSAAVTSDDVRALISDLAVPQAVAWVTYPRGVRIRRVRVPVSPEHEAAAQASA
jgi:hypothetical protein